MTRKYKEVTNERGNVAIVYEENGYLISFPKDESNSDYQRYLRWLENPNEEDNGGLN
jgi:hypothetical protein